MYSTCIFCHAALGANEAIEHFPVGRRLAFDAAKGRLWAVCRSCERWNLSPIDERWEAIEECEKLFRDTRLRVSTDNIGLARLKEGTTLVRVGDPQRPEMAAWRYGDQFGKRRRRYIVNATGAALMIGGVAVATVASSMAGSGISITGSILNLANTGYLHRRRKDPGVRLSINGVVVKLSEDNVSGVRLHANEAQGFALEFSHWPTDQQMKDDRHVSSILPRLRAVHTMPKAIVSGDMAFDAARLILPVVNRGGAKRAEVAAGAKPKKSQRFQTTCFCRLV